MLKPGDTCFYTDTVDYANKPFRVLRIDKDHAICAPNYGNPQFQRFRYRMPLSALHRVVSEEPDDTPEAIPYLLVTPEERLRITLDSHPELTAGHIAILTRIADLSGAEYALATLRAWLETA